MYPGPRGRCQGGVGVGHKQIPCLSFRRGQGSRSAPISHAGQPSQALQIFYVIKKAKTSWPPLSGEAGPPQVCPEGDHTHGRAKGAQPRVEVGAWSKQGLLEPTGRGVGKGEPSQTRHSAPAWFFRAHPQGTSGEVKTGKWLCHLELPSAAAPALAGAQGWATRKAAGQP